MNIKLRNLIEKESERQQKTLGLIPSENYTSPSVRKAVGSVFMHKYSEGYPGARYYEGNEYIDELENICRDMVLKVMLQYERDTVKDDWHANVQVLSGSIANLAVYTAILKPGDKIMGMYLPDGGHLSHGWSYQSKGEKVKSEKGKKKNQKEEMVYMGGNKKITLNSRIYEVVQYKTDPTTLQFDYDFLYELAKKEKPKLLITGGTAYPRNIDYKKMKEIADACGAYYMADVAHEAGLIAGGAVPSPFAYADFVTFTTHKTLRGPRGAVTMCRSKYAEKIDRAVIPGMLGGPFNHNIAGIAQCLFEADTHEFTEYAHQIVKNAQRFAQELIDRGYDVITGGTDKHLILVRLTNKNIGGKYLARALAHAGIIANMNTVPYEKGSPNNPSGIRFGTPILTTRKMKEDEMATVVEFIDHVYEIAKSYVDLPFEVFDKQIAEIFEIKEIKKKVEDLCEEYPLD